MEIDLKVLNQLITVARTGNISRAADELHLSQPALSRSIAAFEKQFGVRLFDRGRQGAALTPVGALAIAEAEALLKQASAISHNLRLYGEGAAGKITLGMGPLIASIVLAELGQHFLQERPQLQIQTSIKSASQLIPDLLGDQIELLFAAGPHLEVHSDIRTEHIASVPLGHMVRAEHPLAKSPAGSVTREQLAHFPTLCGSELSASAPKEGRFLCDNYHILRDTCLHSDGVWISSPLFVKKEIADGRLVTIAVAETSHPDAVELVVLRRSALTPSPAAAAIIDFVQQFFE